MFFKYHLTVKTKITTIYCEVYNICGLLHIIVYNYDNTTKDGRVYKLNYTVVRLSRYIQNGIICI